MRVEQALAQAHRLRRHLDQLVVGDVGERLLQAHHAWRRQAHCLVLAGGAHVGELLGLHRVDFEVVAAAVLADHHAFVDGAAGLDEDLAALRSEEHTSELQSLMRISYAVFCLKKKKKTHYSTPLPTQQK